MWSDNAFFNGPFEPWHQEANTFDLKVIGEIPRELNGVLYRGSANQRLRPTEPNRHHWFEGNGMIFGVFLRDGKAHSANRWVRTASFEAEQAGGAGLYGSGMNGAEVADPPLDPPRKNAANTNVMLFDDRLLVFQETDLPTDLHPTTLETRGDYDFHGDVSGAVTAHWKIDPRTGELLFYGLNGQTVTLYTADRHGKVAPERFQFELGHQGVMHDFVVTEDYAVFHVAPLVFSTENKMQGKPAWLWDPRSATQSRFAVVDRRSGAVRWFATEGDSIVTHFYNGYQDGNRIVVDGHRAEDWGWQPEVAAAAEGLDDYNRWFKDITAKAWRWELDLTTGRTTERQTTDVTGEFPRINDDYMLQKHRYGYFSIITGDYHVTEGLAKYDYEADRTLTIPTGELVSPGEPVFVPREGATGEDDGWILSIWWNPATRLSELVIHDAQHFDAQPVARVQLYQRVPPGFHGNWVDGKVVEAALASDIN